MSASGGKYERGKRFNPNKRGRDFRRGPILGYRKLQELSTAEPSEIVEGLVRCRESYKMLINSEHVKEDWIPLLITSLAKMCSSKMTQNVMELLQELQKSVFLSRHLPQYILQLPFIQEDVENPNNFKEALLCMCTFFKEWLARFPNSYFELPLDAFSGMLKRIIIVNVRDIDEEVDTLLTKRLKKIKLERNSDKKNKEENEGKPPNNFRQISVYPTKDEIQSREEIFLRKNRIERGYDDLNDYLDVQFRLLREDFVAPLRTGIQEILYDAPRDKRSQDLYVYHQVEIHEPLCMKSGVAHRISFDVSKLKKVPWEHSKRLMYGSFLCLSKDKFKTNLIFATVANRKHEDLRKGFIDIRFVQGFEMLNKELRRHKMLMVESPAYFESYRHVLARLQEIDQETFPFQKYLVSCHSNVDPPMYLRGENVKATYDLSGVLDWSSSEVPVLDFESWPAPNESDEPLNKSQLEALQAALSKEFAVIQGPPGTGKTYVGWKIVRALLDNREAWDKECKSPLLMVCYTNHALDQFLEGVLEFTPSGIIRVGGQSSSERLKGLNLSLLTRTSENRPQVLSDLRACQEEIEKEKGNLRRCKTRVLQLSQLKGVIPSHHFDQLAYEEYKYKARKESVVQAWLGIQEIRLFIDKEKDEEEFHTDTSENNIVVDEDAEVLERNLYQKMEGFLPVSQREDRTQKAKGDESVIKLFSEPHVGNLTALTANEAKSEKFRKIWKINKEDDRLRLYLFWLSCYQKDCRDKMRKTSEEYEKICRRLNEVEDNDRLKALREATVIGMTTTGAARHRTVLEQIQPKIVIVEEAAEVLEAHIIAAVSQGTQHLILIGDHKQLKPNPNVYRLATKFNLNVSLFERMVENGMQRNVLTTQHRMRPEISRLVKHIYTDLQDHIPKVGHYGDVLGVKHNVFFIDHQHPEKENKEMRSTSNKHEAEYIRELCRYLLLQGYSPQQITVLTTYTGQLIEMRKLMPRDLFEGVRVTAVDNYQGEENDIILLSLVRSNDSGKVGFLKVNNRVCVALSRARMGLFCIGNFELLARNSDLWSAIVKDMQKQHAIGDALELVCEIHSETTIFAKSSNDFKKAPEGGCTLPCDYRLECGHVCEMACHPIDRQHEEYTCRKKCLRLLCEEHETRCEKDCHYGSPCKPCPVQVQKQIPNCGHIQIVLCGIPAEEFQCQEKCDNYLPCGHRCPAKCFVQCASLDCEEPFVKDLSCGHKLETTCSKQYDFVSCEAPCEVLLECLHPCPGNCTRCRQGRLHVQCQEPCERELVCQHQCDFPCTKNCPPCKKKCQNRCMHSKCPLKCYEICTPCKEPCGWRCEHYVCDRLCGEQCEHARCDKPCRKRLPRCGHPCIGLCGEYCPRLCRVCDEDEVTETFFGTEDEPDALFIELMDCGHVIEVSAMDRYMKRDEPDEQSDERNQTQSIKLIGCPKCNTPIRRSFRYGDIVKQLLRDINSVKREILKQEKKMNLKRAELKRYVKNLAEVAPDCDLFDIMNWLQQRMSVDELTTIENQLRLLKEIYKTRSNAKKELLDSTKLSSNVESHSKSSTDTKRRQFVEEINLELDRLETDLRPFQVSEQVLIDIRDEIIRVRLIVRVRLFEIDMVEKSTSVLTTSAQLRLSNIQSKLTRGKKLSKAESDSIENEINELRIELGLGALSKEERIMIVKAMGFSKGHFFKCPNGHIYAIGECGGAMEESTCPNCQAKIGGTNHKLVAGNEVATEMDGAKHGAWSEHGNLANYGPDELRRLQFE